MKRLISIFLAASIACGGFSALGLSADEGFQTNLSNIHALGGSWTEEGNALHAVGEGDCFAMSDTVVTDFTYSATTTIKGNGAVSLVFRSNDDGSAAYVANVDLNRGDARLFKFPASGVFEFGSYPVNKAEKEYTLRVDCVGTSIKFYVNGKLAVETTDSSYSSGRLGLLIWSNDALFRDVQYTPISESDKPQLTGLKLDNIPDGICFDRTLSDFHGRLPYSQSSVQLTATAPSDTELRISANCGGKTVLEETAVKSGASSPKIPLEVGVTVITYKLTKSCATVASGKITRTYTVTLRRLGKGENNSYDLSYADVVDKMTDLSALADKVQPGESAGESTSYDRRSRYNEVSGKYENWDANDDWGTSFDRTSDGGVILADLTGAGAVVRIWSAEPKSGHVKIFIDGSDEPAVDMPFADYFGSKFPFNLSDISYDAARGKNCYLPITYSKSCKVVAYGDWGRYFHVGYITFAKGTKVEPFSLPLSADGQKALLAAQATFEGLSTKQTGSEKTVSVPAGGSVEIYAASGSGAVTNITVKLENLHEPGEDWKVLSELAIAAYWDGENTPSVWTTLGGFFGSTCGTNPYSSLPMGVYADGTMYASWYMPYSDGAKIVIQNDGKTERRITFSVTSESLSKSDANALLRFHAKWNRLADPDPSSDRFPDSSILSVKGSGRFVGVSMHIYKEYGVGDPQNHSDWWWGEGDEKFFVDGERFPSWFGTGSEDYFGYAWGSWYPFDRPYHAQPFTNGGMWGIGNRLNNRYHIIDSIPFTESFDAYIEKYHRNGYSNQTVTCYFYLEKGSSDGYGAVSLEERTKYYDLPYPEPALFYEGEDLKIIECTGMDKAETQDMSPFGNNWSGGSQLIFKASAGSYVKLYINVPKTSKYDITAIFTKAGDFGIAEHRIDGVTLGSPVDLYNNGVIRSSEITLGKEIELTEGLHVLEVRMTGKNGSSSGYFYGLDFLKLTDVGKAAPPTTGTVPPASTTETAPPTSPETNPPVSTGTNPPSSSPQTAPPTVPGEGQSSAENPSGQEPSQEPSDSSDNSTNGSHLPIVLAVLAGVVAVGAAAVAVIVKRRKGVDSTNKSAPK